MASRATATARAAGVESGAAIDGPGGKALPPSEREETTGVPTSGMPSGNRGGVCEPDAKEVAEGRAEAGVPAWGVTDPSAWILKRAGPVGSGSAGVVCALTVAISSKPAASSGMARRARRAVGTQAIKF